MAFILSSAFVRPAESSSVGPAPYEGFRGCLVLASNKNVYGNFLMLVVKDLGSKFYPLNELQLKVS